MNHFIEKKVEPFCVQAYHNGEFKEITEKNLLGKWRIENGLQMCQANG